MWALSQASSSDPSASPLARWGASLCPAFVPSPAFFHSSPSWQCFCNPQLVLRASPCRVLVLMSGALSCLCAQEGDVGAEQQDYSSSSSSSPKGLLPCVPVPHISAHPAPLATALGHLSPFCKANRSPGKGSSSCSASWGFRHLLLAHTQAAFT